MKKRDVGMKMEGNLEFNNLSNGIRSVVIFEHIRFVESGEIK